MSVVVPFKFDKRGVNIAGIHYRINRIGIEGLLKALRGALKQITKISKMILVLFYRFQISASYNFFIFGVIVLDI